MSQTKRDINTDALSKSSKDNMAPSATETDAVRRQEATAAEQADPTDVETVRRQQHTGNHDKPGPEQGGSDKHGGTRHGAENVEPASVARPGQKGGTGR